MATARKARPRPRKSMARGSASTPNAPLAGCNSTSSRKPVESILPKTLLEELHGIARSDAPITPKLVRALDERHAISDQHGISLRRLRSYLDRARKADLADHPPNTTAGHEVPAPKTLRDHRVRQVSIASILESVFGPLGECDPGLWEQRAYLMLLGLIYEKLIGNDTEFPTDDLVLLGKLLAEHRRVNARVRTGGLAPDAPGDASAAGDAPSNREPLPDHFADVVRQVYGTNFQSPGSTESED